MDKARKRALKQQKRKQALRSEKAKKAQYATPREYLQNSLELIKANQFKKAENMLREGIREHPEVPELYANMVLALERLHKPEKALATAKESAERFPESGDALNNLGALYKFDGQLDLARSAFESSVKNNPGLDDAWRNLTSVKTFKDPQDAHLEAMRARAKRLAGDPSSSASIFFAVAKALEDLGEWDESFANYAKGNRRMRQKANYRREDFEAMVDMTIQLMNEDFFAKPGPKSTTREEPILIVGMPRSGSSLIEQILASHPDVEGVGENPDLGMTLTHLASTTPERVRQTTVMEPDALAPLGRAYVDRLHRRAPDAKRIADKFLLNFIHLGFLNKAVPGARFIHSKRDALDNAFACFKVLFTSNLPFVYDLEDIGHFHVHLVRLMDHWKQRMPDKVLEVEYEELVLDQEGQTRKILEFCGLDWHDDCMRFFETKRRVLSASSTQVRQPIYKTSIKKWQHYEEHLEPLKRALGLTD